MDHFSEDSSLLKKPGCSGRRIVIVIFMCLVVALILIAIAVLAALYGLAVRDLKQTEKQARDLQFEQGLTELKCDVAVLGGGVAGLYIAENLLRENKESNVCVFEREARFGGRIKDHQFKRAPTISLALGAMSFNPKDHHNVRNILSRFNVSSQSWNLKYVGYESRGLISANRDEIKRKAYPSLSLRNITNGTVSDIAKYIFSYETMEKWRPSPTVASFVSRILGTEGRNVLADLNRFNYFFTFGSSVSMVSMISYGAQLAFTDESYPHVRPVGGMSRIIGALMTSCRRHGVRLYGNETVTTLDSDGTGYLIRTSRFIVRAKAVVNTLPPFFFKKVSGTIPQRILKDERFNSLRGVEVFRAGFLYKEPWWERFNVNNVTIRPLKRYLTHSNCLGTIVPYSGRGPNGEAVIQVMYAPSSPCVNRWKSIVSSSEESFILEVKRSLQDAFPGVEVPDAVETTWQYWPVAWNGLKAGSEVPFMNISDWAKRPLAGENFFMAGAAYTLLFQGWTEGALFSAQRILKEGWDIELSAATNDTLARYREAWKKWSKLV